MKVLPALSLAILIATTTACATDRSLSPPVDSELLTVRIKVPEQLKANDLRLIYRSDTCKRIMHNANSVRFDTHDFKGTLQQFVREGDIAEANIPVSGGGKCSWKLSKVMFGVSYRDPAAFGQYFVEGAGGDIEVTVDRHQDYLLRSSGAEVKSLTIGGSYYPIKKEYLRTPKLKRIGITSYDEFSLRFDAPGARSIYFEPVLHSEYVTTILFPKEKNKDSRVIITYPDGSITNDQGEPSFRKLEAIRKKSGGNKLK